MNNLLKERIVRSLIFLGCLITFAAVSYILIVFLHPFLIAFMISFCLNPVVSIVELKWNLKRGLTTFIVIIIFFCLTFSLGYLLFKKIVEELTDMFIQLPTYIEDISLILHNFEQKYLIAFYSLLKDRIPFTLPFNFSITPFFIEKLKTNASIFLQQTILVSTKFISSIANLSLMFIFILLATYFLTKDFSKITYIINKQIPANILNAFRQIKRQIKQSILGLLKAQLILALLSACLTFIGLLFFQFEHVLIITISLFILDLIPYVGIGVLFIPWIMYQFFTNEYTSTIQLSILYMLLIIMRQITEPRLLAKNLGMHPLLTLIILFVSIKVFGAIGFLLTPISLIVFSSLYHARIFHYFINYIKYG